MCVENAWDPIFLSKDPMLEKSFHQTNSFMQHLTSTSNPEDERYQRLEAEIKRLSEENGRLKNQLHGEQKTEPWTSNRRRLSRTPPSFEPPPNRRRRGNDRAGPFQPDETVEPYLSDHIPFFREENRIFSDLRDFEKTCCLIQGSIQGGKSNVIMGLALYLTRVLGHTVIIVVRNFKCDQEQLKDKFKSSGLPWDVEVETKATSDMYRRPTLTVCLENVTQLNKIYRTYDRNRTHANPYSLIIDEADSIAYKMGEPTNGPQNVKCLHDLREHAHHTIMITATCFDVMYLEEKLTNKRLYTVPPHPDYRGFKHPLLKFHHTTEIDLRYRKDEPVSPSLLQWYERLNQLPPFEGKIIEEDGERSAHPIIALQVTELQQNRQLDIACTLAGNVRFQHRFVVLVWNGKGVHVWTSSIHDLPTKPRERKTFEEYKGMQMRVYKKVTIREVLGMLRQDPQRRYRNKVIVIIANKLAARSQNFVSTDYRWHLTHEIMQHAPTKSIPEIMQVIGRIFGIYMYECEGGIPLEIYCSVDDDRDLQQAFYLQDHVIQKAKEIGNEISTEARRMMDLLPLIRVYFEKRFEFVRRTTLKCAEPRWNRVDTEADAEGYDLSEEEEEEDYSDESEEDSDMVLVDDDTEEKYLDSFVKRLKKQINHHNTNTVVRRVLRYYRDHPRVHTQERIMQDCSLTLDNWRSITGWGEHRFDKLLVAVNDGNWVINPVIVDALRVNTLLDQV